VNSWVTSTLCTTFFVALGSLFLGGIYGLQLSHQMVPSIRDLVMKGGITSGVVYPLAMLNCHVVFFQEYRGSSAGAVAAVIAAAAEFARRTAPLAYYCSPACKKLGRTTF